MGRRRRAARHRGPLRPCGLEGVRGTRRHSGARRNRRRRSAIGDRTLRPRGPVPRLLPSSALGDGANGRRTRLRRRGHDALRKPVSVHRDHRRGARARGGGRGRARRVRGLPAFLRRGRAPKPGARHVPAELLRLPLLRSRGRGRAEGAQGGAGGRACRQDRGAGSRTRCRRGRTRRATGTVTSKRRPHDLWRHGSRSAFAPSKQSAERRRDESEGRTRVGVGAGIGADPGSQTAARHSRPQPAPSPPRRECL